MLNHVDFIGNSLPVTSKRMIIHPYRQVPSNCFPNCIIDILIQKTLNINCPKFRRSVITDDPKYGAVETRLKEIITQVCDERGSDLIELETMPDHVHLLVGVDPQYGIHRLVKQIKGRSSRLLRDEFPRLRRRLPTLWTNSYFVATVGGAPLEIIKQYVANQRNV